VLNYVDGIQAFRLGCWLRVGGSAQTEQRIQESDPAKHAAGFDQFHYLETKLIFSTASLLFFLNDLLIKMEGYNSRLVNLVAYNIPPLSTY
jgi:hypothetical protein